MERAFDGATGRGLSENVRQAYRALIDCYDQGDEIFLFGFSRGAFTVRSLAGLIRNCGILRPDQKGLVEDAYDFYRDRDPAKRPDTPAAETYRKEHAIEPATFIHFIGVWDTVGLLGNPLIRHSLINRTLQFHDVKLSSYVKNAFQALAIDEYRPQFQPAIWTQQKHATIQKMEQTWFIGAHSDVGGGYAEPSLSNIALHWLAQKAMQCGLGLDPAGLISRAGNIRQEYMSMPHDSHRGFYRLFSAVPRDIDKPKEKEKDEPLPTNEKLHWTVMERYHRDLGYRPPGLIDYIRRKPQMLEGEPESSPLLARP